MVFGRVNNKYPDSHMNKFDVNVRGGEESCSLVFKSLFNILLIMLRCERCRVSSGINSILILLLFSKNHSFLLIKLLK